MVFSGGMAFYLLTISFPGSAVSIIARDGKEITVLPDMLNLKATGDPP
jgi:hypothetical protein